MSNLDSSEWRHLDCTYDGMATSANANHFATATGTLTFTGGTGLFSGASGSATFTAVFDQVAGSTSAPPVQGMAFYVVQGKVSIGGSGDRQ